MAGSSSTWYAMSARLRATRSSAARFVSLEDAKELSGVVDDAVARFALESLGGVDPSPGDGDRENAGRFRCADVERGVADVRGVGRSCVEPAEGLEDRVLVGLVAH